MSGGGRRPNNNVVDMTKGSKRAAGGGRADSKEPPANFEAEAPAAPSNLTKDEREVWNAVVTELDRLKLISRNDVGVIESYVSMLVRYRNMKSEVDTEGYTVSRNTKTGTIIVDHPLLKHINSLEKSIKTHAIEMGLTPASRSRVSPIGQGDLFKNSPWADF